MRRYKLKDLLTIKNGSDYRHLSNGHVPVYGSGGLMCFVDRAISNKCSILLPRKGTLDNIMFVDEPFWTVDTMYWSEVKEDIVEPYYLYNYLKVLKFDGIRTGSTLPSMTSSAYYDIPINLPDYNKQKRVSNILKLLDKKIALNNKINQELEQMAKTLYDYWFVQFDFPDEKGRPYKSANGKMVYHEVLKREIPVGWEVAKLKTICDVKSGFPFSSEDYAINSQYKLITIKNVLDGYISVDTDNTIKNIPSKMPEYCMLKEGNILLSLTGNVGRVGMVFGTNLLLNQRVGLLDVKDNKWHSYIYLLFLQHSFKVMLEKISTGSNQKNLSPVETERLSILVPPTYIAECFSKHTEPLLKRIIKNYQESYKLQELREFLLPLLMNGQVTVSSEH